MTLLYINLGLGFLLGIMQVFGSSEVLLPLGTGAHIFTVVATVGVIYFFVYMIGKGRNWARITFLVLFIIGMLPFLLVLGQIMAADPIMGMISLGRTAMQVVALVFLFQKPASDWFKEMKAGR